MKNSIKVNEGDKIQYNEHGNVSRVEQTQVLSEIKGNFTQTFHYRIEKEAGLSVNEETEESFPVYSKIEIQYEKEMKEDTLHFAHEHYYKEQISKEHGINLEHIIPISKEEYERGNGQ